jgi:hypothetical protein
MSGNQVILAVLMCFGFIPQVFGQSGEIREKVTNFAKEIARLLKDEKQNQVAISEFTGPPTPKTSAGPMIQQILIEELGKLKVGINDDAFVFVGGNYFIVDNKAGALTVRIQMRVDTKSGKRIDEIVADIGFRGNDDLVKLLALNTDNTERLKSDRETVNEKLKEELKAPPLFIEATKVKTRSNSPYAIEILSRKAGSANAPKTLTPLNKNGQATVEVQRGDEYVIKIHNQSNHEAAVSITIDGVDAFQFYTPESNRPNVFLVPSKAFREIKGWSRGTENVSAFLVGSFAEGAANKALKGSSTIGTITACFHPSWQGNKVPDEFAGGKDSGASATGLGRDIKEQSELVARTVGPLLEAVSIRYTK